MNLEEMFPNKPEQSMNIKNKRISILDTYGENFQENHYITNPAIGRDKQIKELNDVPKTANNQPRYNPCD